MTAGILVEKDHGEENADRNYNPGETIEFTVTVTNNGTVDLTNVKVSDPTPAGLTGTLTLADGESETIGALAAGAHSVLHYTYEVQDADLADTVKVLTNTASAEGSYTYTAEGEDKTGTVTDEDEDDFKLDGKKESFTIVKIADRDKAAIGETIHYTVTVTNTGNVTLNNLEVSDQLSTAALNLDEDNTNIQADEENKVATIVSLTPGAAEEVKYVYTVTEEDVKEDKTLDNVAAVKTPDGDPVPGKTTTDIADITVEKDHGVGNESKEYKSGETIEFIVRVRNSGVVVLENVTAEDPTPAGLTGELILVGSVPEGIKADDDGIIEIGHMEVGAEAVLTYSYTVADGDLADDLKTLVNRAEASGTYSYTDEDGEEHDDGRVEDDAEDPFILPAREESFETTKQLIKLNQKDYAAGSPAAAGDELVYAVTLTNTGNVDLTGIAVSDTLTETYIEPVNGKDTNEIALSLYSDQNCAGEAVTTVDIPKNDTVTLYAKYTVDDNVKHVTNIAISKDDPDDPDPEDPPKVETPVLSVKVEKTVTGIEDAFGNAREEEESADLGDVISYSIVVTNNGEGDLKNVLVEDNHYGEPANGSQALPYTIPTLAVGDEVIFQYTYTVTESDLAGSVENTASAKGHDPDDPDHTVEDEDSTENPTADENPDFEVVKKVISEPANGEAYALGEEILYQITVTNTGNVTLTDILVEDELTGNTGKDAFKTGTLEPVIGDAKPVEDVNFQTFETSYVVKETDLGSKAAFGHVYNVATGKIGDDYMETAHTISDLVGSFTEKADMLSETMEYMTSDISSITESINESTKAISMSAENTQEIVGEINEINTAVEDNNNVSNDLTASVAMFVEEVQEG